MTVVAVAEHFLGQRHERTTVHGIQQFLSLQRNPGNVDSPEPLLDFCLGTLADINEQGSVQYLLTLISGNAADALGNAVSIDDAQLALYEPPKRGDALLPIEHLITVIPDFIEVKKSDGITLQD